MSTSEKKINRKSSLVQLHDTKLHIVEMGSGTPLIILHGGPGLDHHEFADYLDKLATDYRLIFVDQRGQGKSELPDPSTWTLKQMAHDVTELAEKLQLQEYFVLGHSYGAFVALQQAVDFPGKAKKTIISNGVPSSKYLAIVEQNLKNFEPVELREIVAKSWEKEKTAETSKDFAELMEEQFPFHFKDPLNPIIKEYLEKTKETVYSPKILRHFSSEDYGSIEVEDQLDKITQPTLVMTGRFDRVCSVEAAEAMTKNIPNAKLKIFENSAHMEFVEENELYIQTVRDFLK